MANQMSDILSQMELVSGCKVIDKSYIESERMFTLKLEGQKLIATITEDLVKSLHAMSGDEQNHFVTGKSLPQALILASTKPQYDKRLFIELRVQYMKITSSENVVYINCSEYQNKKQFMYTICSELVIFMY